MSISVSKNPLDPLNNADERAKALFLEFVKASSGMPYEVILSASVNMIVNVLRQEQSKRQQALDKMDMLTTKAKEILASHYDNNGGRKNVFPFTQHVIIDSKIPKG